MAWTAQRKIFQDKFDALNTTDLSGTITQLNTSLGTYVMHGGVNTNSPNSDYTAVTSQLQKVKDLKAKYSALNNDIMNYLAEKTTQPQLLTVLEENGAMQNQIQRLRKLNDEIKVDVDTAIARDQLLRSKNTESSSHTLFLLDHPVRKERLPLLWAISIIFLGIGLYIVGMLSPVFQFDYMSVYYYSTSLLSSSMVLFPLTIVLVCIIIFLALKIAGVFN